MSTSTTQMSATEALDFHHFSAHNAVQAQLACPEASCEAYRRSGEQGAAITTWIMRPSREDEGDQKPVRRPKRVVVFCRHQVERSH